MLISGFSRSRLGALGGLILLAIGACQPDEELERATVLAPLLRYPAFSTSDAVVLSGGSAFGRRQVIIVAVVSKFRAFQAKTFNGPVARDLPAAVNLCILAGDRQSIVRQPNIAAAAKIQIAFAFIICDMTGIYITDFQIYRITPGPIN